MDLRLTPIPIHGLASPANPFQTAFWASVKKMNGWDSHAFSYQAGGMTYQLLVLTRKLFLSTCIAYVPYGPEGLTDHHQLKELAEELKQLLPKNCFTIRFDVPWAGDDASQLPARMKKTTYPIQPEGTVIVNLEGGPDEVFRQFRTRAKRNIKRSIHEIVVTCWEGNPDEFDSWYETYTYTSVRDAFTPRSKAYMENVLMLGRDSSLGVESRLYLAWIGNSVIGGNIVLYTKDKALYLFGSSQHEYASASPSYALQWHTVQESIKRGCKTYDLYGIAPEDDEEHHLHSLNMFKTGFGGDLIYRAGCFDYCYKKLLYTPYRVIETIHMASARS